MGTYVNPGKSAYEISLNAEVFVDKTPMLHYLNTVAKSPQRYVSVSRPRRFGKTMAADMISAYYDREADSRTLFENLALSGCEPVQIGSRQVRWDDYLGKFDVIRLVMTDFMEDMENVSDMLSYMTQEVIDELKEKYPDINCRPQSKLRVVMEKVYAHTKRQFVVVIDEWDAVFRVWSDDKEGQKKYLDFLRDWLKDKTYIALAYMTGILPIKKYGEHSALNMFTEFSMTSPKDLAPYVGFTKQDVQRLCEERNLNYDLLKEWYDGYRLSNKPTEELIEGDLQDDSRRVYEIYCPLSVVNAALYKKLENYWSRTENFEALADFIRRDFDGLKDAVALLMDGGRLRIDISTYQNDMTTFHGRDDILSLLIHLGYLGYDDEQKEVFIPNKEILDEFRASTKGNEWTDAFRDYHISEQLLKATWNKDAQTVAGLVERAHNRADNKTYHNEAALSYAVQLAYYAAGKYYTVFPEPDTGKGYADLIFVPSPKYPDKPALVVELKYNKSADGAIAQIKRMEYPDRLTHYKGNTLLVGINYDRDAAGGSAEFKHHSCVIEEA